MKPICVPCERFYRLKKSGYYFIEGMPLINGAKPGKNNSNAWKPYKLWAGDLYECPYCKAQIIVGVGMRPVAEHYEPKFSEIVTAYGASLLIKDC